MGKAGTLKTLPPGVGRGPGPKQPCSWMVPTGLQGSRCQCWAWGGTPGWGRKQSWLCGGSTRG